MSATTIKPIAAGQPKESIEEFEKLVAESFQGELIPAEMGSEGTSDTALQLNDTASSTEPDATAIPEEKVS